MEYILWINLSYKCIKFLNIISEIERIIDNFYFLSEQAVVAILIQV